MNKIKVSNKNLIIKMMQLIYDKQKTKKNN